jgi:hypothetical protein
MIPIVFCMDGRTIKAIHALSNLIAEHPDEMVYVFRRTHLKKLCGDEKGFIGDQRRYKYWPD